jgi:hypothetical protein
MKKAIIFMIMLFAVSGFAQTKSKNVKLSKEFALNASQKAVIKSNKLNIEFVKVLEDSRCPVGVDCVWAGNAKVQIKISKGKAAAQTFEMNTGLAPKTITFDGYKIELLTLNPAPNTDTEMAKRKYTASFIVKK